MEEFLIFAVIGFFAQLVDGSLGMGFGVISASALLATGVPPAQVSASVHGAKLFTSGTSAISHLMHGNVDKPTFWRLSVAGAAGGVLGALLVSAVPGSTIKPFVLGYLTLLGLFILIKAWGPRFIRDRSPLFSKPPVVPIGATGGFVDGVGGGGWGPVVTTSMIGTGGTPRYTIGTVNAAEFVVTVFIVMAFAGASITGLWQDAGELMDNFVAVLGLVLGGIPAAVIAGYLPKKVDARSLTGLVGLLVISLAAYQLWQILR
jgi:uncharacterized protein